MKAGRHAGVPSAQALADLIARYEQGHCNEVHAAALGMTRRVPGYGFGWKLLGAVSRRLGKTGESLAASQRAARLMPNDADVHNNLGDMLCTMGRLDEAEAALRRALQLRPEFAAALNNQAVVLQQMGRHEEADRLFQRALQCRPDLAQAHSNRLFLLSHGDALSPQQLLRAHLAFDQQHGEPLRAGWPVHTNRRDPHKRLRVGFVSGDLRRHAAAHFIAPIWRALDRAEVELLVYDNSPQRDDVTAMLSSMANGWTDAAQLGDAELAERVRADSVDILVDLSGHTANNRLLVFARKPAPVQVTAIGYPHTTGLAAMDYRISDHFRMPPGLESQYVEKLVRVPCASTFESGAAPDVNALPALQTGALSFGSFQRGIKITPATLALWARVLRALPDSRMLIGALQAGAAQRRVHDALVAHGVASSRLEFRGPMSMVDYLALHHRIDLLLDSCPYPGGTTIHHGLWMGVPTLTRVGESVVSWQGAANLLRMGLDEFVAADDAGYERLARRWAADLPALAALRSGLRQRWQRNPLLRPETVARGMQAAFRGMWQRWCAGLPPAPFEIGAQEIAG